MIINTQVKKFDELHRKEFKLARTDKLTGLANRRYFDQKLSEDVQYSDETGNPLNILIFDLDNFKKFNDTNGHTWGDKLLTLFSDIIKHNIRQSDVPVRYGGEEFLLIIRDLDYERARNVGERIRNQLEKQYIYIKCEDDTKKWATVSCGVAQYPTDSKSIWEVIESADKALYNAKANGKNIIVCYKDIKVKV
jgi:diguanylate cyclase (GGDEF)-like protein